MRLELCQKLKNSGYPQYQKAFPSSNYGEHPNLIYSPIILEVISLCGDKFNSLIRKGENIWIATGGTHSGFYGDEFLCQGVDPDEAIVNLWIKINNKKY